MYVCGLNNIILTIRSAKTDNDYIENSKKNLLWRSGIVWISKFMMKKALTCMVVQVLSK